MDKINGKLLNYYGFKTISYHDILNMPYRLGETYYDWGDWQQPLVSEDDIFWKSKEFSIKYLFDERLTTKTFKEVVNELSSLSTFLLETKHGDYSVKIKTLSKVKTLAFTKELTILFIEHKPIFNYVLPNPIGGEGISIDGYDLKKDFGILVSKIKPINYLESIKSTNTTVHKTSLKFSNYRNFNVLELDCVKQYESFSDLYETTEKIKKLLSLPNYRIINLYNENYNCFLTEGFKIIFEGNNVVKFKIRLNVTANFVESGFVMNGFVN